MVSLVHNPSLAAVSWAGLTLVVQSGVTLALTSGTADFWRSVLAKAVSLKLVARSDLSWLLQGGRYSGVIAFKPVVSSAPFSAVDSQC